MPADLRRLTMVGVGVGVVAVGVVVALGSGDNPTAPRDFDGSGAATTSRSRTAPPPAFEPADRAEGTPITRETVTETARIRDHRTEPGPVEGGTPRAPDTRKIPRPPRRVPRTPRATRSHSPLPYLPRDPRDLVSPSCRVCVTTTPH